MPIGVPVPFGSPSYHSHASPAANEPPTTFKSINPAPHKTVPVELMELGAVEVGVTVMVSEFGAVRAADYNSRMRYYSVYVEELVDAKLVHQVWDDGGDFEVLQREAGTWHETKDILIHTWPDGPHGFDLEIEGDSVVALTWENPVLHDRIHIQRAIGSQPMETIATLPANSIKYLDAALEKMSSYQNVWQTSAAEVAKHFQKSC